MSAKRSFTDEIVSRLGTPQEPWGLGDFLFLGVILLAIAAWIIVEIRIGEAIVNFFRSLGASSDHSDQNDEK
ncbi:hypothetical protein [Qipengyuania aquimaris]|uniref:Uncharacterized protein n=1 Tax=Qipengyuania aquimaris TaxID=255984 RepID=A0A9Q3S2I1_9SPHN|nr:hypothetical protein [Qipengyuania aquimaris]MBY6218807.1 hypothetical protein [Qipengyuania aquimaris]